MMEQVCRTCSGVGRRAQIRRQLLGQVVESKFPQELVKSAVYGIGRDLAISRQLVEAGSRVESAILRGRGGRRCRQIDGAYVITLALIG
jgi:hypothetical protein